jgi:hypothetical protein
LELAAGFALNTDSFGGAAITVRYLNVTESSGST